MENKSESRTSAEEFIQQLKEDCIHNIIQYERDERHWFPNGSFDDGVAFGKYRWDIDVLEKIEKWEDSQ